MIKITGLSVPLDYDAAALRELSAKRLEIEESLVTDVIIIRQSVDAKNKENVHFTLTVGVFVCSDEWRTIWQRHDKNITRLAESAYSIPIRKTAKPGSNRPVVVGSGPAGLFAALLLSQAGLAPILLERGLDVDRRKESIRIFWESGTLDTNCNVLFGEGGAGTFSDGKLKVGSMDPQKSKVLDEFIHAGAPPEIAYLEKPHLGTDRLPEIVRAIRKEIIRLGGEVRFNAQVDEILHRNKNVEGIRYLVCGTGRREEIATSEVVLAIGSSARDTYEKLLVGGIRMESRPIAVGVRIEHPQHRIDTIRYGKFAGRKELGAADYRMVVHLPNGRGVYTFCMCPGGTVIAASSDEDCLVTNGMSNYRRSGENANTALLVTIDKKEYGNSHPFAGIDYRQRIEQAAFLAGGRGYRAPVQRLEDFMNKTNSRMFGEVRPTYRPGTDFAEAEAYLPSDVTDSLRQAIIGMDEWMPGFAFPDALLTGAETRSTSAVCIPRGEDLQADGWKGLYPCGEGAGYAGGILSAAVDGIRCAERIIG